jgi:hypothetical protein
MTSTRFASRLFAGAMVAVGAAMFASGLTLPEPMLEPVGPAAFPLWAGAALVALSAVILVQSFRPVTPDQDDDEFGMALDVRPRRDLALATATLTVLFVAVMDLGWLGFRWAAVAYLFALIMVLARGRPRMIPVAAAIALVLGIGLHLVFTRFFYIDLPG